MTEFVCAVQPVSIESGELAPRLLAFVSAAQDLLPGPELGRIERGADGTWCYVQESSHGVARLSVAELLCIADRITARNAELEMELAGRHPANRPLRQRNPHS